MLLLFFNPSLHTFLRVPARWTERCAGRKYWQAGTWEGMRAGRRQGNDADRVTLARSSHMQCYIPLGKLDLHLNGSLPAQMKMKWIARGFKVKSILVRAVKVKSSLCAGKSASFSSSSGAVVMSHLARSPAPLLCSQKGCWCASTVCSLLTQLGSVWSWMNRNRLVNTLGFALAYFLHDPYT